MAQNNLKSWGERALLRRILPALQKSSPSRFRVRPGDDAAVMRSPKNAVLSIDGLTDGTHFKLSWASLVRKKTGAPLGRALGWKLMGASLSDLAAMGDTHDRWAMLFVGAPATLSGEFLMDFFKGVRDVCQRDGLVLAGGDTVRSRTLTLTAAVGGTLRGPGILTRGGAGPGDLIGITGFVGDAAQGLAVLLGQRRLSNRQEEAAFIRRFFDHRPLYRQGRILAQMPGVTSGMDLSDSVIESLELLLEDKNLGCEIDLETVPCSPLYRRRFGVQPSLLTGGEDYGLIFTVKPPAAARLKNRLRFSIIGRVLKRGAGVQVLQNGRPLSIPRYFQHFK